MEQLLHTGWTDLARPPRVDLGSELRRALVWQTGWMAAVVAIVLAVNLALKLLAQ